MAGRRRRRPQACRVCVKRNLDAAHSPVAIAMFCSSIKYVVIIIIHMIEHEHYCSEEGIVERTVMCGISIHFAQFSGCVPSVVRMVSSRYTARRRHSIDMPQ